MSQKTMKIYCCKCNKFLKEVPSQSDVQGDSHGGYCEKCLMKELEALKESRKK